MRKILRSTLLACSLAVGMLAAATPADANSSHATTSLASRTKRVCGPDIHEIEHINVVWVDHGFPVGKRKRSVSLLSDFTQKYCYLEDHYYDNTGETVPLHLHMSVNVAGASEWCRKPDGFNGVTAKGHMSQAWTNPETYTELDRLLCDPDTRQHIEIPLSHTRRFMWHHGVAPRWDVMWHVELRGRHAIAAITVGSFTR